LLLGISALCWRERNRRKYLLMGWLWFLGTLVPVIGLVQVGLQSLADRYTYVPYFGLFIMLVWGAGDLLNIGRNPRATGRNPRVSKGGNNEETTLANARVSAAKIAVPICVIAFSILGFLAYKQTSHWKSSETLYTHTLRSRRTIIFC